MKERSPIPFLLGLYFSINFVFSFFCFKKNDKSLVLYHINYFTTELLYQYMNLGRRRISGYSVPRTDGESKIKHIKREERVEGSRKVIRSFFVGPKEEVINLNGEETSTTKGVSPDTEQREGGHSPEHQSVREGTERLCRGVERVV